MKKTLEGVLQTIKAHTETLLCAEHPDGGCAGPASCLTRMNELVSKAEELRRTERMRYLGVLALLAECSVYMGDDRGLHGSGEVGDLRDSIERALKDACADGSLRYRRILDRFEIEPVGRPNE